MSETTEKAFEITNTSAETLAEFRADGSIWIAPELAALIRTKVSVLCCEAAKNMAPPVELRFD